MKRSFSKRVQIEREVLSIVNSIDTLQAPLYGLTKLAIESWQIANPGLSDEFCNLVLQIATRQKLESDASRQIFDDTEIDTSVPISKLLARLRTGAYN